VFSVDYQKAPESPYPRGLADCWQVYNWLLNESHKFFKIRDDKRIILAGDSAGGNLCFGLTNLCIENNVKVPYAIVGFYPGIFDVIRSRQSEYEILHTKSVTFLRRSSFII
jgi:acetyl esterase/lipase